MKPLEVAVELLRPLRARLRLDARRLADPLDGDLVLACGHLFEDVRHGRDLVAGSRAVLDAACRAGVQDLGAVERDLRALADRIKAEDARKVPY